MEEGNRRKVILVGAGPGAVDLITVRGLRAIEEADFIVHDRLVCPELLKEAKKEGVRFVNVGKAPEKKRFPQSEINRILVALGTGQHEDIIVPNGSSIVRLKGGDPFIFGLGGDEVLALEEAGISYEVVPGVSSATAVPALAGIPLTQKGVATSFTVLSGHLAPGREGAADWDHIPRHRSTLVVLMGVKTLPSICSHLIDKCEWASETPLAVIQSGTTGKQVIHRSTLADAKELEGHIASPCIIVIGQVCSILEDCKLASWASSASQIGDESRVWGEARAVPSEQDEEI